MIITIDGPSASGKSSVARVLAARLDYYYLYSGLLYRALAYILLNTYHYTMAQLDNVAHAHIDYILSPERFVYTYDSTTQEHIFFEHTDITPLCKTAQIDTASSIISTQAYVRERINALQHSLAGSYNSIVDGRDAGSVVFAHADYIFFLTASLEKRAYRWQAAQKSDGHTYTLAEAQEYITNRDMRDQQRAVAPLTIPEGGYVIDTTFLTIEQTVQYIIDYVKK